MKIFPVFLTIAAVLISMTASDAKADWRFKKDELYADKNPIQGVEQTTTRASYCFDAGFDFSIFGAGILPDTGSNGIGGGLGFAYFFNRNIGLEVDYSIFGQGTAEQVYGGKVIYRVPLDGGGFSGDWAPYVFGGAGGISMGATQGYYSVGGGIDVRLESWGCIGFFSEYSYNFVDASLADFSQVRIGVRLPF